MKNFFDHFFTTSNPKVRIGASLIFLVPLLVLVDSILSPYGLIETRDQFIQYLFITIMLFGLGTMVYGYLEGDKTEKTDNYKANLDSEQAGATDKKIQGLLHELRHIRNESQKDLIGILNSIKAEVIKQNELRLDNSQRNEIFETLQKSFSENINEDFFQKINEDIARRISEVKHQQLDMILHDFDRIKVRIRYEIENLSRKANLNLVIGSLTTVAALCALWFIIFQNGTEFENYTTLLYHYIPRLSLIIFIEVFAFFFLRLYKLNLNDIKYFQNELTTVEFKLSSLTTAINFGTDKDISMVTQEFSKTERNFILQKGETTVDLEKYKAEDRDLKDILKSLSSAVAKKSNLYK